MYESGPTELRTFARLVMDKRDEAIRSAVGDMRGAFNTAFAKRSAEMLATTSPEVQGAVEDLVVAAVDTALFSVLRLLGEEAAVLHVRIGDSVETGVDPVEASLDCGGGLPMDYWSWITDGDSHPSPK